ncbi:MAG TPA: hypothetical protein VFG13_12535 [Blastococcus sp.]|nr:hypothetical protein [Blastococcus sp.]
MSPRAPDWLARLAGRRRAPDAEPTAAADAALRNRFATLARAAGVTPPPLEVERDPRGRLLPARVDWSEEEDRVVVSSRLVAADAPEQTWHLAACLGWWTSPEPRRTRNRGRVAIGIVAVPYVIAGFAGLSDSIDLPRVAVFLLGTALAAMFTWAHHAASRRHVLALDAAGRSVLRSAGHDPATLGRLVFGHVDDPAWYRRPLSNVPPPSRRLAEAARPVVTPARALF